MNTPNKLTVIRMVLVPVFMLFMGFCNIGMQIAGLVIFIIASITDWLDGYLARRDGLVTNFGKFMDPLADKMLTTAAFLVLMDMGYVSAWVLLIILFREFLVSGIRLIAVGEGKVIAASIWGKAKTVSQMIAIIASFVLVIAPWFNEWDCLLINIMVWISTALTLISGADYLIKNRDFVKVKDNEKN